MSDDFSHTISGLLQKRRDLLTEAELIRDRLAEIKNDILALDRTLNTFDYKGDLDEMMPRQRRIAIFGKGEFVRSILDEIRKSKRPLLTREIAEALARSRGCDPRDRKLVTELCRRIKEALRPYRQKGLLEVGKDEKGKSLWAIHSWVGPDT